ncbi:nuclear pore protein 84/107 [Epithele typhae]|uniref:nuclear pore protein 84/107 n=1 Tax=Epithele typhae TaxID=378194 RepID=UPI00200765DB|nr:nuclear pore protein 84/107 [Epithele typhae]KAH9940156.1 nuclear pore protein 84/107 [Epithele typhae]
MSEALYASCAEVLSVCQANKDDLEALLHPEYGFAPRLRHICDQQLADMHDASMESVSTQEFEALKMESDTWALLQALMSLRKTTPPEYPHPRDLLAENPYTPPATLAQSIMHASPLLSALVVVREWLHDSAPMPATPGVTNGYWRFTRNAVLQGKRTGRQGAGVVEELDPDAPNRAAGEEGKGLAPDDATYEKLVIQALYAHVRAGQLEEAVDLCRKANQPWRAASIRGALLFQWRAIANEPRDEDAMDDEDVEGSQQWSGNVRRKMWKTVCQSAALNVPLPPAERALYASLAPTTSTSVALKSVCRTWEDHLWALVSMACEERLSRGLADIERECFWEGGLGALESSAVSGEQAPTHDLDEDTWEHEVVQTLQELSNIPVIDGAPADHPYHVSQLHIILDQTDSLLESFASGLQEGLYVSAPEYSAMTRFFAHVCLFFQMIDVPVSPFATQTILEAYLQVLENAGQRELIAMYAGALGDNAVERYAMFLTSLELSGDAEERRLALNRARDHGLDVERVAVVTAERTIEKTFTILPPTKGPLPGIQAVEPPPTDAEWLLVRSIEWTTFFETTYDTALEQANVILRYFLGRGRVQVAKNLLDMLPPELGTLPEPEDEATEFMHYRQFFAVWDSLARVGECAALEQPQMNKESRASWLGDYRTLIDQTRDLVLKLLTNDWLVFDTPGSTVDRRRKDLARIRQIYVPELILRLHAALVRSRARLPENVKHALALVNVVADSRYRLYDAFSPQEGRRLGDYLAAVRGAVLAGLEGGGSDPFRILSV